MVSAGPSAPAGSPALDMLFSVPGGVGGSACWIVAFDLTGTSLDFALDGDCDTVFDGTSAQDDFGWTLSLADQGTGGNNGPVLCGDPSNFPYGDGTYYQNSGANQGTGLGTVDQFWTRDGTFYANGCYWFGGYQNGNPFASFWLSLFGEEGDTCGFEAFKYCVATANSTGSPADISATGTGAAAGDITITSRPVPDQPGIFFHGEDPVQLPFGNGFLCTSGGIVRGAVAVGSGGLASYVYDNSDAKHSLGAFVGTMRHFQHWFRDPMGGAAAFNTSNAVMSCISP